MTPGRWCREPPPYSLPKPALPTRSPPFDEKPLLSAEMARQHASPDNMLIVTYVNKNRLDFALTWVRHLLAVNQPHFLVGALDVEALRGLEEHGVPCYLIDYSKLSGADTGWGTQAFRMLGLYKVQMVLSLARTGVDTLTVDADAFIVRDPLPYLRALPQADVLMSSDQLSATRGYADQGLEGEGAFGSAFNIGFIFIRACASRPPLTLSSFAPPLDECVRTRPTRAGARSSLLRSGATSATASRVRGTRTFSPRR